MYNNLKEYNQAKKLHEEAMTIRKKSFGEDHADVATIYHNSAVLYDNLKDTIKPKNFTKKQWRFAKIFFVNIMPMSQQVITTWQYCTTTWNNTIKPKNFTKKHW